MDEERSTEPPEGGRAVARLRPDECDVELSRSLRAPEFHSATERLDRLGADEELVLRLGLSRFGGRDWQRTAEEFAVYGLAVLRAWIRTREIFGKVQYRTGMSLSQPPEGWLDDPDVANELANLTIAIACPAFRQVLMEHKWRSDGGASLRTFFIGQCLYRLLNVYRDAAGLERRRRANEATGAAAEFDGWIDPSTIPAGDAAVGRLRIAEHLADVKPLPRQAMLLQAAGASYDEIAAELQIPNAKAVENLLAYERKRQNRIHPREAS